MMDKKFVNDFVIPKPEMIDLTDLQLEEVAAPPTIQPLQAATQTFCVSDECCCSSSVVALTACGDFVVPATVTTDLTDCTGRVIEANVRIENVCCNKQVNVGVLLCDDSSNIVGLKVKKLGPFLPCDPVSCTTVDAGTFCFVVEDSICDSNTFTLKAISNYTNIGTCPPCVCSS
jgi:hypothetical protein